MRLRVLTSFPSLRRTPGRRLRCSVAAMLLFAAGSLIAPPAAAQADGASLDSADILRALLERRPGMTEAELANDPALQFADRFADHFAASAAERDPAALLDLAVHATRIRVPGYRFDRILMDACSSEDIRAALDHLAMMELEHPGEAVALARGALLLLDEAASRHVVSQEMEGLQASRARYLMLSPDKWTEATDSLRAGDGTSAPRDRAWAAILEGSSDPGVVQHATALWRWVEPSQHPSLHRALAVRILDQRGISYDVQADDAAIDAFIALVAELGYSLQRQEAIDWAKEQAAARDGKIGTLGARVLRWDAALRLALQDPEGALARAGSALSGPCDTETWLELTLLTGLAHQRALRMDEAASAFADVVDTATDSPQGRRALAELRWMVESDLIRPSERLGAVMSAAAEQAR